MYSTTPPTNYPYMQQQSYMRPQAPMIKGRPVTSLEEARAATIDFDGSIFYFPDVANKRIYTKQINMDGTATLNMYELKEIPIAQPVEQQASFVTREEFEKVLAQLRADLLQASEAPNKITF